MRCLHPLSIVQNKTEQVVACGRCHACRINRIQEWTTRILHERSLYDYDNCVFVTLTYEDSHLPAYGSLSKLDLQNFFKRLRKVLLELPEPRTFRYFACGEYGKRRGRPHYHLLLFGISPRDKELIERAWSIYHPETKDCYEWFEPIGHIDKELGHVDPASATYTAKYIGKQIFGYKSKETYGHREREFMLSSRRPGIGHDKAIKYLDKWSKLGYIYIQGFKRVIPKYYVSKMDDVTKARHKMRSLISYSTSMWRKGVKENMTQEQLWQREYDQRPGVEQSLIKKQELNSSERL